MAEERSEGATTVDIDCGCERASAAPWGRCSGSFRRWWSGGLELATSLGDKLGKRNRAHVTLIEKARTHFCEAALHSITRRRYGRSGTVTHPSAIANANCRCGCARPTWRGC